MLTAAERFNRNVSPEPMSGCWLWTASLYESGYGQFNDGKKISAHRFSWLMHKGPVTDGLFVLHRCDVRCCVNPEHLFLGTQQDNIDDMIAKGRQVPTPRKTHCRNGHPFVGDNLTHDKDGAQVCRRCQSDTQLRYKARNLEAVRKYQRERAAKLRAEGK